MFFPVFFVLCLVAQLYPTLGDPMDSVHGDSPGKNTRVPCPPSGDLPNPGIEPRSPTLQVDSLPSEPLANFLWEADDLSHSQLQVLFLLTVYSFSIFNYKECNQFDFSIDHLVMYMCKVVSWFVEKGCMLWLVHSRGRIQLAFALLHFVFQDQTWLLLQVYLDFILLHSNLQWWIEHLFSVF